MSGWAAKQAKKAEWAEARKLDGLDNKETTVNDTRDAAMGKGEDQLFEKKLSKEEQKAEKERKKAEAKAKRDAKKAAKGKPLSKKKSKENLEKLAQQEAEAAARVDESEPTASRGKSTSSRRSRPRRSSMRTRRTFPCVAASSMRVPSPRWVVFELRRVSFHLRAPSPRHRRGAAMMTFTTESSKIRT